MAIARYPAAFDALQLIDDSAHNASELVAAWATAHGLRGEWIEVTALETLGAWRLTPMGQFRKRGGVWRIRYYRNGESLIAGAVPRTNDEVDNDD